MFLLTILSSITHCLGACLTYLHGSMWLSKYEFVYLLLVLPLQVNPSLDVTPRLLERLSLGDFGRIVGADPDYISTQEDQHVGADLITGSCKE